MSIFETIRQDLAPRVQALRNGKMLYTITLQGTGRKWQTTNTIEAHRFTHSFGPSAGFFMECNPHLGEDIPSVQECYFEEDIFEVYRAFQRLCDVLIPSKVNLYQ